MDIRRPILFLGLCLTVRLGLAYFAKVYPEVASRYALLALLPVIGWLWIYFVSGRETGPEVFGGKIWWNSLRPVHAALWSAFAYMSYNGMPMAWVPLFTDALIGLTGWGYQVGGGTP
jgi:hypothetical protein